MGLLRDESGLPSWAESVRRWLPPAGHSMVIAVSGGADSMALWALCAAMGRSEQHWRLIIWHLDHGLRVDSAADWAAIQSAHAILGGTLVREQVDIPALQQETGLGVEALGRRERYARLQACAHAHQATTIMTAHHRDDQAETVLLQALRGSGPIGLMGIARRRRLTDTISIVRPVLHVRRHLLRDYCSQRSIAWCEDVTNRDQQFARNKIRHTVLPAMELLMPGATAAWAQVATRVRVRSRPDRAAARQWWQQHGDQPANRLRIPESMAESARLFVWRTLLRRLSAPVEREIIQHLDALATGAVGRRFHVGKWVLLRHQQDISWELAQPVGDVDPVVIAGVGRWAYGDAVLIIDELMQAPERCQLPMDQALFAVAALRGHLTVRTAELGERWQPLGCGHRLVRKSLAEHGIPSRQRAVTPVVADGEGIVWIPGVGVAERVRVTPDTSQIWHAQWRTATTEKPD